MKFMIKMTKKNGKIIYIIILLLIQYFIKNTNKISVISKYILNNNNRDNNNRDKIIKDINNKIFGILKKNFTYINVLYIKSLRRFGNFFISLNNAIILCEFLNCKRIVIEKNKFINNKLFYQKYKLTIDPNHSFNNSDNCSVTLHCDFFFKYLNFSALGKVNRFYVFRNEILNNLPKVKINNDVLYIYLRGGDIFIHLNKENKNYIQPPLCFYKMVLNKFIFKKVIIISEDMSNPIISILLKDYPYIKYNKNNIKLDMAYLVNSYNIIYGTSSFLTSIIKLNQKLKFLWEYDFFTLTVRYKFLHYSAYTFSFNYTIYKMNTSENYKKLMYPFINSEKQRKFMIEEKCDNNFYLTSPRIL